MATGIVEIKQSKGIERWLMFVVVIVTWAMSAAVTYGIVTTRIEWLTQRMDNVEREIPYYVPRTEYEGSRSDLAGRLDRIERKIDALR